MSLRQTIINRLKVNIMENSLSYADFAAMSNGNGMNSQWNNPFMYLIWLAMFSGNGFGFGNNGAANTMSIQDLQNLVQDNHNSDLTMQAVNGNTAAITQLAGILNTSTDTITAAINTMSSNMQQGFCGVKTEILQQGAAINLANCQQTNTILQQSQAVQNALSAGFNNIGFQMERNICDVKETSTANTQRIIDTLNNHWTSEQQTLINSLQSQLSEQRIFNAVSASKSTATTTT